MSLFEGVDRVAVILYLLLVAAGMVSILSASYDDTISGFFSLEHFYMKQAVWIAAAFGAALVILLLDARYYHMYAYYAYAAGIVLLVAVLLFGREVNGAKAWFEFGSVRVQPVEFVKIATALAVARMMSNYSFSIRRTGDLLRVAFVILLPLAIIVLQNDTGSGVVLCSFLFVLYREGLNKWICIPIILVAALFIFSFLFTPLFLLALLVIIFTVSDAMMIGAWRAHAVFLASVTLASALLYLVSVLFWEGALSAYVCAVIVMAVAVVAAAVYALRKNISAIFVTLALFVGSMIFVPTADMIFETILQPHQRERILSFLGIESPFLTVERENHRAILIDGHGVRNFLGSLIFGFLRGSFHGFSLFRGRSRYTLIGVGKHRSRKHSRTHHKCQQHGTESLKFHPAFPPVHS